jgi:hypothetical protein
MTQKPSPEWPCPSNNPTFTGKAGKAAPECTDIRKTSIEPEHQRAATAPNTAQRIGPCFTIEQADRKLLS